MRKIRKKIKDPSKLRAYRRKLRIRKIVNGTSERPRLCAIKTNKHLQVQVIDDQLGQTLVTVQTYGKNGSPQVNKSVEGAKEIGTKLGLALKEKGISRVVFDRNGLAFTGVIKALADSVKEQGIQI